MKKSCYLLLLVLVAACSSRPPLPISSIDSQQRQQGLQQLENWQIEGRMAYMDAHEKHSASFIWHQQHRWFSLDLNTFIGTNILHLQQKSDGAELEMDNKHYQRPTAGILLSELTGWQLPVAQFSNWLKGQALGTEQVQYSPQGWINQLSWQGWTINYADFRLVNGTLLPFDIRLQHQQQRIKIRINQWQLN